MNIQGYSNDFGANTIYGYKSMSTEGINATTDETKITTLHFSTEDSIIELNARPDQEVSTGDYTGFISKYKSGNDIKYSGIVNNKNDTEINPDDFSIFKHADNVQDNSITNAVLANVQMDTAKCVKLELNNATNNYKTGLFPSASLASSYNLYLPSSSNTGFIETDTDGKLSFKKTIKCLYYAIFNECLKS